MENQSEKRGQVRLAVNREVVVRDRSNGSVLGKLANLNAQGFMLIGNVDVNEDSIYSMALEWDSDADERGSIELSAECLWKSESGSGEQFWAGFQLVEISPALEDQLLELAQQFGE